MRKKEHEAKWLQKEKTRKEDEERERKKIEREKKSS